MSLKLPNYKFAFMVNDQKLFMKRYYIVMKYVEAHLKLGLIQPISHGLKTCPFDPLCSTFDLIICPK